jgi:hypothetical protein
MGMKYRVELTRVELAEIEIEADSQSQAERFALEEDTHGDIDYEWEETEAKAFLVDELK